MVRKRFDKILGLLPFFIYAIMVGFVWIRLISGHYIPTLKHILALTLVFINIVIYFWKYEKGLIVTACLFVLSTFSFVAVQVNLTSSSYFFKAGSMKMALPSINGPSLLLLLLFFILNRKFLKGFLNR
jgi:hypothetical protein